MTNKLSLVNLFAVLLYTTFVNAALQNSGAMSAAVSGVSAIYRQTPANETTSVALAKQGENQTGATVSAELFSADTLKHIEATTANNKQPLRVLFLSADTGGGHRASAEALAKQFENHFPGSTYDLVDVWSLDGVFPYKTLVETYQHLSAHPKQWKWFYHYSNMVPNSFIANRHSKFMCEKKIRKRIASYDPDVVVSVHPAMNHVPRVSTGKLSKEHQKHIPFFTVVTDLGTGHGMWFERQVEKIYVASERMFKLARRRGAPKQNIVMTGLPIRHDFALQADNMGDRTTESGKKYQKKIKKALKLDTKKKMVLVMGGGEGVGSLSAIVNELYVKFTEQGVDAEILVVCGRNEKLKSDLATRDWDAVVEESKNPKPRKRFRSAPRRSKEIQAALDRAECSGESEKKGEVKVVGLGYVNKMADYMVAADVLVSKAGPGTIAEAAAVGLPIMLTSFLPGQEAGNVDVVLDAGFGDYCEDPDGIASEVSCWLQDENLLQTMSHRTSEVGQPTAAAEIVQDIASITHSWMNVNLVASDGVRRSILDSSY